MEDTKACRRCGETIKKQAKVCKHCKSDIRPWHFRHPILSIILGFFAFTFIIAMISPSSSSTINSTTSTSGEPVLELMSMNTYTEYGYHHITGEVKNISTENLENVMAVGVFKDSEGNVIKTAEALIEFDPLLPGQSSPFEVLDTYHPSVTSGSVTFTTLWGTPLNTQDSRSL
jgi:hypothetical protein